MLQLLFMLIMVFLPYISAVSINLERSIRNLVPRRRGFPLARCRAVTERLPGQYRLEFRRKV